MRPHLFLAQSSFVVLFKQNLLQLSGFQFNPSRLLSSLPVLSSYSSSSSPCVFSTTTLQSSSFLFSHDPICKFKPNLLSTRSYCKNVDYSDDQIYENVVYEDLTVDKFKQLIKTEDDDKLIAEILSVYEYNKFDTGEVPSTIKSNQMYELMQMPRSVWPISMKYLYEKEFQAKVKKHHKSQAPKSATYVDLQRIKDEGRKITLGIRFDPKTGAPIYGEWLNSHFIRIRQYEYRCSFVPNLLTSYLFGQRLIIDCDYDYTVIEAKQVAHDIQKAFAYNRASIEPFNFTLTGLKSQMLRNLLNEYTISLDSNYGNLGIDTYNETFTELFPNQKFIYLSSHSKKVLDKFDEDAVYIIGGLPSKLHEPLSLKKSITKKIPSYCFPTHTLSFRAMKNAKCFDITECTKIMLNLKETKDILSAVRDGVSYGRLKTSEELQDEQKNRLNKMLSNMKKIKKFKPTIK